jgi:L-lactate dehydrogenase complex protein LldG
MPENIAKFTERARAVQTVVAEVSSFAEAFEYAADITMKHGALSIAAPGIGEENLALLETICQKKNLMLLSEDLREKAGRIDTGLTMADWGIAETATLVIDSKSEDVRISTMLSETHVVILPRSRIVADAGDLEGELTQMMKTAPGYLAFISGASRTADIERVLTIGVHGPQELHVLIVEEGGDDQDTP